MKKIFLCHYLIMTCFCWTSKEKSFAFKKICTSTPCFVIKTKFLLAKEPIKKFRFFIDKPRCFAYKNFVFISKG